ncbi:glycosyltransferase [Symbioplanes lichenis]|uniref:glycosyltransferase n=1 Tax=Symbioplanes lichenis TaxID=1629072 RepID=UPI0027388F7E|nr:glycosyltransferase [Actinoplanes lichenis]
MARVMIVGSGWRFTSGISYYTCRLSNELSAEHEVAALLMRGLVPEQAYPGRARVGREVHSATDYLPEVDVYEGVDWSWGRSLLDGLRFLRDFRPDVVVFQWWTGAVLHTYRMLAAQARRLGARVVVEFHEVQDTGEIKVPLVRDYVRWGLPRLLDKCDGFVLHSDFDRDLLRSAYRLPGVPTVIVPHGPYDQHRPPAPTPRPGHEPVRLLFFGTIRPYKGLEDLVSAFDLIAAEEPDAYRLRVVGETWENWQLPLDLIRRSPHRELISLTNRYVDDKEVAAAFAGADVVVLPYRRSSSSGPLHIAMAAGLPTVVTGVGGLVEAAAGYAGVVHVPPADPVALAAGIRAAAKLKGRTFADARSWDDTRAAVRALLGELGIATPVRTGGAR